jgi:hypothetical protein
MKKTTTAITPKQSIRPDSKNEGSLVCVHRIVEDLIDITPDHSKYVYYCEKCYECFDSLQSSK